MVLDRVKAILRLKDESGKFTKAQAYYADDTAVQDQVRCGNCFYYDGENGKCDLVSEEGDPGPGRISREGTCSLFDAMPPRITFIQWAWGRDDKDGITPERIRATAYMFTYAGLNEEPPQELKDKSLLEIEDVRRVIKGKVVQTIHDFRK